MKVKFTTADILFPFYNQMTDPSPAKNISLSELIPLVESPRIGPKLTAPLITPYHAQGKTKPYALEAPYHAIVVDHDHDNLTKNDIKAIYDSYGMAYIAYTTSSHRIISPKNPNGEARWKVIIFLARPVSQDQWVEYAIGATLKVNADTAQARYYQGFYAPNIQNEDAIYESINRTDLPFVDLSDTDHPFVSACFNAYQSNEARKDQEAINARPMPRVVNSHGTVIEKVKQGFSLSEVLTRHEYRQKGRKYLSPESESGSPGVWIDDTGSRCYSHHGSADPLSSLNNDGHSLDVFDVLCILDYAGDVTRAVKELAPQVDPVGQKERQREYMQEQARINAEAQKPRNLESQIIEGVTGQKIKIEKFKSKIRYYSGADIIAQPRSIEWIIVGMLSMYESILIHAGGGLGKSMFVLYIILSLGGYRNRAEDSLGGFLGDFVIPQRRCSLVLGSENGWVSTYQRLHAMTGSSDQLTEGLKNIFFMGQYDDTTISGKVFLDDDFCDFLVGFILDLEQAENVKIDILVVDPLISFSGANDENNSAEMRPALDAIDRVCKQAKCTPLVIHHDKKDGGDYRGSTAINDWTRNRISLKKEFIAENRITDQSPDGTVTGRRVAQIPVIRVTHTKCNNFQMFDSFLVQMNKHLHFERVNEQMSPEDTEKANTVAQALKDMGGYAESANALAKVYQDLAGLGLTAAKNHIALAADNGLIHRNPVTIKGKSTYEYTLVEDV